MSNHYLSRITRHTTEVECGCGAPYYLHAAFCKQYDGFHVDDAEVQDKYCACPIPPQEELNDRWFDGLESAFNEYWDR